MTPWDDDNEEIYEEEIVEGIWFCPNCNTENAGANMRCGGCGQTREEVDFVYDPQAKAITDEEELKKAQQGPDWVCNYCSTSNLHGVKRCKQCGADFDGEFRQIEDEPIAKGVKKAEGGPSAASREIDKSATEVRQDALATAAGSKKGCPCSCCSIFFSLFALLIFSSIANWLGIGRTTYLVTERQWSRTVSIEQSSIETAAAWEGEVPKDGREISRSSLVYRHKKVQVGTKPVPRFVKERRQVSREFLQGFFVAHKSWQRKIQLQKRSYKKESAWEGRVPSGVRVISQSREVYEYERIRRSRQVTERVPYKVADGYTRELVRVKNLGNGRFKKIYRKKKRYRTKYRDERRTEYYTDKKPIYKTKYRYEREIWSRGRTVETTGEQEQLPTWPTLNLSADEREAKREQSLRVRLDSPDKKTRYTHYCSSEAEYLSLTDGMKDVRPLPGGSGSGDTSTDTDDGGSGDNDGGSGDTSTDTDDGGSGDNDGGSGDNGSPVEAEEPHPFDAIYEGLPGERTVEVEKIFQEPVYEMQPLYRNRIVFEYDKWTKARKKKATGNTDAIPEWPELDLQENERQGTRYELYTIRFKDDDEGRKVVYLTKNQNEYAKLKPGTKWYAKKMKSPNEIEAIEWRD